MDMFNDLIKKLTGWVDQLFAYFGLYTTKYSKYIVYIIGGLVLAKMLKVKLNINTGTKGSHR